MKTSAIPAAGAAPASTQPAVATATNTGNDEAQKLVDAIAAQGNLVRELKSAKPADKAKVDAAVAQLLALKEQQKKLAGNDVPAAAPAATTAKPAAAPAPAPASAPAPAASPSSDAQKLADAITEQGSVVRELKTAKPADKAKVDAAVAQLLALKDQYKKLTGTDAPTAAAPRAEKPKDAKPAPVEAKPKEVKPKEVKPAQAPKPKPVAAAAAESAEGKDDSKKVCRLGLEASREQDLAEWYSQVITKADMIEYYDVSGTLSMHMAALDPIPTGERMLCPASVVVPDLGAHSRFLRRQDQGDGSGECLLPAVCLAGRIAAREGPHCGLCARGGMGHQVWRHGAGRAHCHSPHERDGDVPVVRQVDPVSPRPAAQGKLCA